MMPIREVVIFPHMMTPFVVGRESSVRALEEALASDRKIFLAAQHDASVDEPRPDEIFSVGTVANIVQSVKQSDGNIKVLVEGIERGKILSVSEDEGFFRATVRTTNFRIEPGPQLDALTSRVTGLFEQYVKISQNVNYDSMVTQIRPDDPGKLADTVGANLQLALEEKQELLEIFDPIDRLTRVAEMLDVEIEKLNVDRSIQGRVKRQIDKAQKEYYLNEKIKAIQKELGRGEKSEFDELKKKIETAGMTKDATGKGHGGVEAAGADAAHVGRVHGVAQLPGLAAGRAVEEKIQGDPRPAARAERARERSLRPGKDQGADSRIPGGAAAGEGSQGLDPVLRRASRRGQNVAGDVDRQGYRTQVRAAYRWAECATKPKSAAIAAPISARCPARFCR